jgi:hypothetical protein
VQDLDDAVDREEHRAGVQLADRLHLELHRGHDAVVPAAPAQCPEELGLVVGVGADQPAVGGDELDRGDGVRLHAVLARQPADAPEERVADDAHVRRRPVQPGEAQLRQARRDGLPPRGGAHAHPTGLCVDLDAGQRRRVHDHGALE